MDLISLFFSRIRQVKKRIIGQLNICKNIT